jgi:AcrR family transcriptional regulator
VKGAMDSKGEKTSKDEKEDRRTRRTRQLLGHAFVDLMTEKRYDSITVQDIIDRADIGRSTFYAHYRDKEDLFVREFESQLADLGHQIEPGSAGEMPLVPSLGLFRHVRDHHQLYRALARGRGLEVIQKTSQGYLSRTVEERLEALASEGQIADVPRPVVAAYLAGSLLSLLQWWLDNDMPHTPEQMGEFYQRLVTPNAKAAPGSKTTDGLATGRRWGESPPRKGSR